MKPWWEQLWWDYVKRGRRLALLLVISSLWLESIRRNLWWILTTLLIAATITGIVASYQELQRQDEVERR